MVLSYAGIICKSNSDKATEQLSLLNNMKQMKRDGQFITHPKCIT